MMGDGFAIDPEEGTGLFAFDVEAEAVFPTKHAIGLRGADGLEMLIHIRIDTVNLKEQGLECLVKKGDAVSKRQKMLTFDLTGIKEKVTSLITPVVFTNLEGSKHIVLKK